MTNKLLYDLTGLDLEQIVFSHEDILELNPQRSEFEQLDSIALYRPEEQLIVALRNLRPDEFWVRGHFPGRPLFPGVLMLEAAAQLCAFYCRKTLDTTTTYGFGGADRVRFRRIVTPGDQMVLIGKAQVVTPRRSLFQTQGLVEGQLAFEASILGIALPGT